ncbi:MAG: acetylxylan esterase [Bacteroidota bacterium]|nr:acetylxylan esterase [Bacteroidota bacterium]
MIQKFIFNFIVFIFSYQLFAQKTSSTINDEAEVPSYELPQLLITSSGEKINTPSDWERFRRPEIHSYFANSVYGIVPGSLDIDKAEVLDIEPAALEGKAIRKQVKLNFKKGNKSISMYLLIYLPAGKKNSPVFLAYNFKGNYSVISDPAILINGKKQSELNGEELKKFKTNDRGGRSSRWAIDKMIDAGYGLVTINYNNVDPDKNDFTDGIHSLFYRVGQMTPNNNEWGSLSAWAWGLSRIMDFLETETLVDHKKVILFGHSRLGKTALWAGANDQRFSIVISNNSGCGGAALSRRRFGEKVSDINTNYPHWFAKNFHNFNDNEAALDVDQHMLIALIAPRPVYVASASKDAWADPRGEFLAAKEASQIYKLYEKKGIETEEMPLVNTPFHGTVGYHLRDGKHDVTNFDWEQYIKFADLHFKSN